MVTTITNGMSGLNARNAINDNFSEKISGILDTDVTLAANSDVRVSSQKAIKAYVDANSGGSVAIGSVTGLASGIATFLGTPSSANLRSAVTDESGTGALLFAGGALGTPASGTLTNCTGLPAAGVAGTAAVIGANTFTAAQTAPAYIVGSTNANAQTGTSYTLVSGDNGKIVTLNNGSAITLTVPASLGAGFCCTLIQLGAGQVTVTASSTTINKRVGAKLTGQYSLATLYAYAADTFILGGDLSA